jgi:RNA recognition motif-containing protein
MGSKLYVGNLSYNTTEDELREAFGKDGRQVAEVAIVMDRETGRPRGFAFVTMGSDADAQKAIQALDGQSLSGRTLKVNEAQDRRGGGGGGGGGGAGRRSFGGGGGGRDGGGGRGGRDRDDRY